MLSSVARCFQVNEEVIRGISGGYVVTLMISFHGDARGSTQECVGYHGGYMLH